MRDKKGLFAGCLLGGGYRGCFRLSSGIYEIL